MQLDDYHLTKKLGEGFSAQVRLATRQSDNEQFAIKMFDLEKPEFNARAFRLLQEEV